MMDKKKFYINGEWVNPIKENNFDVINPSNEEVSAVISLGSSEDTNAAVKAAKKSFKIPLLPKYFILKASISSFD